ncbi:MAG: hypothetical protein AB8B66_04110 [Rickettsiaceae bacterium]
MTNSNKNILNSQINEVVNKIEKAQAEIAFCSTSSSSNIQLMIEELKALKKEFEQKGIELNNTMSEFKESSQSLENTTRLISILPDKMSERLSDIPKTFNRSIADSVPSLGKEIGSTLEAGVESFRIQSEAMLNTTNSDLSRAVNKLLGDANQINHDLNRNLNLYTSKLGQIMDACSKFRVRNFCWTVLLSCIFSTIVSIIAFWMMK